MESDKLPQVLFLEATSVGAEGYRVEMENKSGNVEIFVKGTSLPDFCSPLLLSA